MSNQRTEKEIYRRQSIELAENAKQQIVIPSSVILETDDDFVLGSLVRKMFQNKIQELNEQLAHLKNLD